MNASAFPARLKELRELARLSQEGLAKLAKVAHRSVSAWEQGKSFPTWPSVIALCKALGVECSAFTVEAADTRLPGPGRPRKDTD